MHFYADIEKENRAIRKLKKEFKKSFSPEEQREAKFYTDVATDEYYKWRFELNGMYIEMIYDFKQNVVTFVKKRVIA